MNRRSKRRSAAVDGYLRYLKPGALAQLRDRKMNARTHHRPSDTQISLYQSISSSSPASFSPSRSSIEARSGQQQEVDGSVAVVDGDLPCFTVRFYGPRFPQRKKLMAARSMFCSDPLDDPGPVMDAFTNDFVAAH
ncbi:hypothetical protein R6Q57_008764 [Mikania cordata]